MKLKFKRFSFVLLLIVTSALLSACIQEPHKILRIGAILWPGYEPLYLAKKLGYFEKQPIKIIDYLSNTDSILAFKNNNLDAGAFTLDETMQILDAGVDLEVILITDISNGGDVILANKNIKSVKDLEGKSVAVESTAVGAYVLKRALELNHMKLTDIHIVPSSSMEQITKFKAGKIDAAVTFDPYRSQLIKMGKKEIFNSTQIPNEVVDVLVIRKKYAKRYPETVHYLINSWFKALKYQEENPVKSARFSLKRFNTTTENYIAGLKLLKYPSKEENMLLLDAKDSPMLKQQHKMIQILKELRRISSTPSLVGHLNNGFIH